MRHLVIFPVTCRKLPQLKHANKTLNGWWIWASLHSSAVHLCSTAPSYSLHICKVFWKAPGLSCVDSGEVRSKKVHLPWGGCPWRVLLISLRGKELCIDVFCVSVELHLLGLSWLWARLQWSSLTVRWRNSDLVQVSPPGVWLLSLPWEQFQNSAVSISSFRAKVELSSSSAGSVRSTWSDDAG